jgi:ribonuclease Y
LDEAQRHLVQREQRVDRQIEGLSERERALHEQWASLQSDRRELELRQAEISQAIEARRKAVQNAARLSEAEARALILKEAEESARKDAVDLARHVVEQARAKADEEAKRIVTLAIQRYAGEHTFETTTAIVALSGDDIKGRIIGREGRNIRAFEAATGITVLIDDTPNAVVLSGFDPVRREIARQAMERLVQDGRIHPTRIEEVIAKVTQEMEETILKSGEEAVLKLGLPPMPVDMSRILGRLRFRCSFSQNILGHSIEVGRLCGLMAAELGMDVSLAKRAGLLHDIGKAVNHEVEGSHAAIGAELARRHGEPEIIVDAISAHHNDHPPASLIGVLVSAADAISASRPGARSESMTTYLKRLENLEQIGGSFAGVERCYAVQAGRELRVMVQPNCIDDHHAYVLARNIARRIENDLQYPGQIRVTVVRETRCVEFAK